MNCDKCKNYNWYYDWCKKWHCEVDNRAIYSCYEPYREEEVSEE